MGTFLESNVSNWRGIIGRASNVFTKQNNCHREPQKWYGRVGRTWKKVRGRGLPPDLVETGWSERSEWGPASAIHSGGGTLKGGMLGLGLTGSPDGEVEAWSCTGTSTLQLSQRAEITQGDLPRRIIFSPSLNGNWILIGAFRTESEL